LSKVINEPTWSQSIVFIDENGGGGGAAAKTFDEENKIGWSTPELVG
jgi:hypothetical protein